MNGAGALRQRIPPYRSRTLLDMSAGESCVRCGREHKRETVVPAHYTGVRRDAYGGGLGVKVHDFLVADLCDECHAYMDSSSRDKEGRWGHSEEFQHYVILTLIKRFHAGGFAIWSSKHNRFARSLPEAQQLTTERT
jgi:hypothetical protein